MDPLAPFACQTADNYDKLTKKYKILSFSLNAGRLTKSNKDSTSPAFNALMLAGWLQNYSDTSCGGSVAEWLERRI